MLSLKVITKDDQAMFKTTQVFGWSKFPQDDHSNVRLTTVDTHGQENRFEDIIPEDNLISIRLVDHTDGRSYIYKARDILEHRDVLVDIVSTYASVDDLLADTINKGAVTFNEKDVNAVLGGLTPYQIIKSFVGKAPLPGDPRGLRIARKNNGAKVIRIDDTHPHDLFQAFDMLKRKESPHA